MEYPFHNSILNQLDSNSRYSSIESLSKPYDVYQANSIAFAPQSEFAHVFSNYQLTHQSSNQLSYNDRSNGILSFAPAQNNVANDYHGELHINHRYDEPHSFSSSNSTDGFDSTIHRSTSPNQYKESGQFDNSVDQQSRQEIASDDGDGTHDISNSSGPRSITESDDDIQHTGNETDKQQRLLSKQNNSDEQTPAQVAVTNVVNSRNHGARIRHTANLSEFAGIETTGDSSKKSKLAQNDKQNRGAVASLNGAVSSSPSPTAKNVSLIPHQQTLKSAIATIGDEMPNGQVSTKNSIGAKKISKSTTSKLSIAADNTASAHESVRYSLIDNRATKSIDTNLSVTELNAKDQPVVLKEFRQFLDDIGNDSIVRHARLVIKGEQNGELRLLIKPPELGVVRIKFSLHQNTVEGKFIVDNVLAKDVMERNIADIQRHLRDNGLESRGIEVSLHNNAHSSFARSDRFGFSDPHDAAYVSQVAIDNTSDSSNDVHFHSYMKKNNRVLIDLLA